MVSNFKLWSNIFSHFLMIQNGYSRNILHKQSSIKLCCFSFKRAGILGTNRIHVLLVTNIHEAKVTNEIHFVRMFFLNRWINILWMETYALVNPSNKTDLNWKSYLNFLITFILKKIIFIFMNFFNKLVTSHEFYNIFSS